MEPETEIWPAYKGLSFIYTEDSQFAKYLQRKLKEKAGTTYEKNGNIYAWQFLVENKLLKKTVLFWDKNKALIYKDLATPTLNGKRVASVSPSKPPEIGVESQLPVEATISG